jgi:DNA mismatch repair protein MutH
MRIITRVNAVINLRKYIGQDLRILALKHKITIFETGKQNNGWKGLVLEKLAGLGTNISKAQNGLTFELKSVSFYLKEGELVPKYTMAITMINQKELLKSDFYESHCWAKLKSMVFCAVMWRGKNAVSAELLRVGSFDFSKDDEIIKEIESDYDFIRTKLRTRGFCSFKSSYYHG